MGKTPWCRGGKEGCASWDGGKGTWGGLARVFSTVSVCVRVQERAGDLKKMHKGINVASSNITVAGSRLMLLDKVDAAVEVLKNLLKVVNAVRVKVSTVRTILVLLVCSESTQEISSNDPKEMTEEDVQNILEIVPVSEFKVEALQRRPNCIMELGEREVQFSSASVDKEKALWVELKRLFEPDADDVMWKLQRYMHAQLTWKLYTDCGVHHVSSTKGHDIFMLIEKDYPLPNAVMILMLSGKLQV
nr:hypothetical protein [Tanacetum cinerariifolium]